MTENENFTWQESEDNKFNEESNSNETSEQLKKETNFKKIENDGWILAGTYLIGWLIFLIIFKF